MNNIANLPNTTSSKSSVTDTLPESHLDIQKKLSVISLDGLEKLSEQFRTLFLIKMPDRIKGEMSIRKRLERVTYHQIRFYIMSSTHRKKAIAKLNLHGASYKQNGMFLYTTLAGASIVTDCLSVEDSQKYLLIEKEVLKRINSNKYYDAVARVDFDNGFKWAVRDREFANEYQFKSLAEMDKALKCGLIKEMFPVFLVSEWGFPRYLNPKKWERPSFIKKLSSREETFKPVIDIKAGDDLSKKIQEMGLPGFFNNALEEAILYPLYLNLTNLTVKNVVREPGKAKQDFTEHLLLKSSLRSLLLDSLTREEKLKEELGINMSNNVELKPDSKPHKLIAALSKEGAVRKSIEELLKTDIGNYRVASKFKESIELLERELARLQKETNRLISTQTLKNLSDRELYRMLISRGKNITENTEEFNKFVQNLSAWKQVSDKTFGIKLKKYSNIQFEKNGLCFMFGAMIGYFEIFSVLRITGSITGQLATVGTAPTFVQTLAANIANSLATLGQVIIGTYAAYRTIEGIDKINSLSNWIKKIESSKILDKDTQGLISNYMRNRRSVEVADKLVGAPLLFTGEAMLFLANPFVPLPFGLPIALGGSALTIAGLISSLTTTIIGTKRFNLDSVPSKEEILILRENKKIPVSGKLPNETDFQANLRWKVQQLLELSKKNREKLAWLNIYNKITTKSRTYKKPENAGDMEELTTDVMLQSIKKYRFKYQKNMKDECATLFSQPDTKNIIKNNINLYYNDRVEFYKNLCESVTNEPIKVTEETFPEAHPSYKSALALLDTLKARNFGDAFERVLMNQLIIQKKGKDNFRGAAYAPYVSRIETRKIRHIYIPGVVPLVRARFPVHMLPYKTKSIYTFDDKLFMHDFKHYSKLDISRKKVVDSLIQAMFTEYGSVVDNVFKLNVKHNLKSDVFRPLWIEIPQLVHQEHVAEKLYQEAKKIKKPISLNLQ